MKHVKAGDFLILFLILIAIIFSFKKFFSSKGTTVSVNANEKEYIFDLAKNGEYEVQGLIGYTKLEIKDEKVRIIDSCCPNKTCVNQGWGSTIVCLPNKVIINVESNGGFDAIAE